MANSPTIVAASLDDKALRDSIDKLVQYVEQGTQKMAKSMDAAVEQMKKKLAELGNTKVDFGGTSDGGATRRTRSQQAETQAVKETTQARKELKMTLDQQAQALQTAMQPKSARDSFYAFFQGFREQAQHLEQLIKSWESLILQRKIGEFEAFGAQIDNAKQKINDLKNEITQLRKDQPEGYRNTIKEREAQIESLKQKIIELRNEQQKTANAPIEDNAYLTKLRAEHERVVNAMKEEVAEKQASKNATETQLAEEKKRTEEIRKQAKAIRESKEWKETGRYWIGENQFIDPKVYTGTKREKQEIGSLEEQILRYQQKQTDEINKQTTAEQHYSNAVKEASEALRTQIRGTKVDAIDVAGRTIYADTSDLTIEQQLNSLVKERGKDFILQHEVALAIEQDEKRISEELAKQNQKIKETSTTRQKNSFSTYEDLRQSIAHVLGIQGSQVKLTDTQKASYEQLSRSLTQLKQTYDRLSDAERNSDAGQALIVSMHEVERSMQKIRSQASRPINLQEALGLKENTLDDISYKMRMLASYRSGLDVNTRGGEIREVNAEYDRLKKKMDEVMQKNQSMIASNNALGRSWNYMKNRLAFYFTVGASTQFIKSLVDIRGQYELLERSIGILIDSAQNGSKIFSELNAMAIKSPFTAMELGAAAKQLVAYDVAAKDVVETTKKLADMAAAVGIPIQQLTYALGQVKAYGYLNARDARMFSNAGIPLVKELADRYTELEGRLVSTSDVYDRIKKKAISYEDVMETVNKMTDEGGKFFNFQEKAADTLKVRIANLTLAWNNMLNEIGKDEQGVLSGMLNVTKEIFERWRDIINILQSIAINFGMLKAIQIARLMLLSKEITLTRTLAILQTTLGKGAASAFSGLVGILKNLANPVTLALGALTALSVVLTKVAMDYADLQKANDAFNKSISDGAEENIKSIDKFFQDYKKQLEGISSASSVDQQKMWERIQEEIEKTTKNAQQYIDTLQNIQNVGDRIVFGEKILEQEQEIEKEAKRLADKGVFDLGGGFADDSLAEDLIEYEKGLREITKEYGSVSNAIAEHSMKSRKMMADYSTQVTEIGVELDKFTSKLDQADLSKIMGDNPETQLADLRDYANLIRDSFLATEKGQKISTEGQAKLNAAIDQWVAKQAWANFAIKDVQVRTIEENRTAWETFFDQLSRKERERLDYLIKTNQTGSKDFQDLWDKATKRMADNATTSYELIQGQIANLRNTPDILINVVYRERTEKELDVQRQGYKDRYLTPQGSGVLSADSYFAEQERLTKKYGKFIKKEGEDNVEWEKRLGQTYQDNTKNIQSLNGQIDELNKRKKNTQNLTKDDINYINSEIEAKKNEKKAYEEDNETLLELKKNEGFNYDQFKKGGKGGSKKDPVLDALKQEISLVQSLQSEYDKLAKSGASSEEALETIQGAYGKTIKLLNNQLRGMGLPELSTQLITGKDPNKALEHFQKTLDNLVSKGMLNLERSKEIEAVIQKFTLSAKTYNLDKITKGLNNELDKLKDEYELAVELDANPELGNMFMDLFDIDPNELPHSIDKYAEKVVAALNKSLRERKNNLQLPTIDLTTDDIKAFEEMTKTGGLDEKSFEAIKKAWEDIRNLRKKDAEDTIKLTRDLQYKLADTNGKIAIEEEKLAVLQKKLAKETNEEKKRLLELQIQDQQNAIAKLKEEVLQMLPTYKNLFNSIVEHSAVVTRRIAKQWKDALKNAVVTNKNGKKYYTITDPQSGQQTTIDEKRYGTEIDKVNGKLRETQSSLAKIKEAFTKGEEVDFAQGFNYIAGEAKKVSDGLHAIADIVSQLGGEDAEEAVEIINDIATNIEGLATAGEGVTQILSGDYIGGVVNVIKGTWQAVSTWFDNSNKKIDRQIRSSERTVKSLENAYAELEYQIEKSMGTAETEARRAAIENKKLLLAELERQLQLEESRKKKDRDEDKIIELQGLIGSTKREIQELTDDVVNNLLGSDIKSAAEEFVSTWVGAWRQGEDTLEALGDKFDDMIDNMIAKSIASYLVSKRIQKIFDAVDEATDEKSEGGAEITTDELKRLKSLVGDKSIAEQINDDLTNLYNMLGIAYGVDAETEKNLSALQQGLQSMNETTAESLEAYMNGVSQQVFYQSSLMEQIRDAVIGMDFDVNLGVMSQILLQLQTSFQTQQAIHSILEGWSSANGMSVRVEMI